MLSIDGLFVGATTQRRSFSPIQQNVQNNLSPSSSQFFKLIAVNDNVNLTRSFTTTTTTTTSDGNDIYQQAIQLMDRVKEIEKQREQERSNKMYEAYQKSQEAQNDPKTQGVKVIKTLVKEARKDKKKKDADDDNENNPENIQKQAFDLLKRAAYEYKHPEAAVQLGNTLLSQAAKEKDITSQKAAVVQAMELFRTAGEAGSRVGWYNLGHLLWTGFPPYDDDDDAEEGGGGTEEPIGDDDDEVVDDRIIPTDMHEAMSAFTKAIDLGDSDAMYLVGVHRLTQGGKENYHSGTKLIERAADAGHGGALYYLALLHLNGEPNIGLEPCSLEEFAERLDRAVDAGNVDARFVRAHSYYHGTEGYPQNFKKALDDFLLAADEGHAESAVSAGAMYHNGVGTLSDHRKGFELYQLAGELGSKEGWANVVDCWRQGLGVPKSEETARYIEKTMLKDV
jgi:TPR repeat protein